MSKLSLLFLHRRRLSVSNAINLSDAFRRIAEDAIENSDIERKALSMATYTLAKVVPVENVIEFRRLRQAQEEAERPFEYEDDATPAAKHPSCDRG